MLLLQLLKIRNQSFSLNSRRIIPYKTIKLLKNSSRTTEWVDYDTVTLSYPPEYAESYYPSITIYSLTSCCQRLTKRSCWNKASVATLIESSNFHAHCTVVMIKEEIEWNGHWRWVDFRLKHPCLQDTFCNRLRMIQVRSMRCLQITDNITTRTM